MSPQRVAVAVGSSNPRVTAMLAHFFSVAFQVHRRLHGFAPEVMTFMATDFQAPELVLSVGEPVKLLVPPHDLSIVAVVSYGLSREECDQLAKAPSSALTFQLDDHACFSESDIERSSIDLADICVAVAAQIMQAMTAQPALGG